MPDDIRIRRELPSPVAVRQDHDVIVSALGFFGEKRSADHRPYAQCREPLRRDHCTEHRFARAVAVNNAEIMAVVGGDSLEEAGLRLKGGGNSPPEGGGPGGWRRSPDFVQP